MKHPTPCLSENAALEAQAALAEQRKLQALDRLMAKLDTPPEKDAFHLAMENLIDADKTAREARGR